MEFWSRETESDWLVKDGVPRDAVPGLIENSLRKMDPGTGAQICVVRMSERWAEDRRPYYNVYPTIIPLLLKINLDFDASMARLPLPVLCIRFPKTNNPLDPVRTIICGNITFFHDTERDPATGLPLKCAGFGMSVDKGDTDIGAKGHRIPLTDYIVFPTTPGRTVDEAIHYVADLTCASALPQNFSKPEEIDVVRMCQYIRLCLCLGILDKDHTLINPDVLGKDEAAYREAARQNDLAALDVVIDRAFRRRGPGWEVGKAYERVPGGPYVVPPHPQRYWVGKGRTSPIIKVRRGFTVERDKILEIPTGYEADELCPGCGSKGFPKSTIPGRCTFCDGTEGGNGPETEKEMTHV